MTGDRLTTFVNEACDGSYVVGVIGNDVHYFSYGSPVNIVEVSRTC